MTATVVALSLLAALAAATEVPYIEADKGHLVKQKNLVRLLFHVQQPTTAKEELEIANSFKPIDNVENYQFKDKVEVFWKYYTEYGFLPRDEVFSIYYKKHLNQPRALFDLFYYAKDFDTFYKTAVWAREHLNPGLFVYSYTVAVAHRKDTKFVTLPAPYEVNPQLFVNAEVIQKAHDARLRDMCYKIGRKLPFSQSLVSMQPLETRVLSINTEILISTTTSATDPKVTSTTFVEVHDVHPTYHYSGFLGDNVWFGGVIDVDSSRKEPYIFYANYNGFPVANNPEELLSYFTEDVGLNTFFAYLHYAEPFWMNPSNYSIPALESRGESFFFFLQQLMARYYLERLSNHLPDVKPVDYTHPVLVGYYPELRLQNGIDAPARPEGVYQSNFDQLYVERIQNYEKRIRDAVDLGYIYGHNFEKFNLREKDLTNVLGNIIEGNDESVNYEFYGSIYRYLISLFGHIADPFHKYGAPPSILEQPETQLRDPLYYTVVKRILSFFYQYKNQLQPYSKNDLEHPGVSIESISFDRLVTYFDDFDFTINNALPFSKPEDSDKFNYVARQHRLNHKPFSYQLNVKSDKEVDSVVRIFIGPKYDAYGREFTLEERRQYYFLLDSFNQILSAGENGIKRSCSQSPLFTKDALRLSDLYHSTVQALDGEGKFYPDQFRSQYGFPQRLMLPRGTRSGLPLSVFAIVTPAVNGSGHFLLAHGDHHAAGFPLDRRVVEFEFDVPNVYFGETFVVHRRVEDINSTA